MSRWTHIRGGMELTSRPHEFKGQKSTAYGSKDAYLPFPEEQLKIRAPRPGLTFASETDEEQEATLTFKVRIYSLPRARKYIERAFQLLPQGEVGIKYSINQDSDYCWSSSSCFDYPCDEKAFKKAVEKMYRDDSWSLSFKDLDRYYHIETDMIDRVEGINIGIRTDVRYCSGEEMLEGLEKFFNYLRENDIDVEDGYLEWEDEYNVYDEERHYYYCWRCSRITDETEVLYNFHKIDYDTNKILWTKTYKRPKITKLNKQGKECECIDWDAEIIVEEKTYE